MCANVCHYQGHRSTQAALLVGDEGGLREVARLVVAAGASDAPVLVTGETGTGKNVTARAIHEASDRRGGAFITVNCATLPANLIEAELFGAEKGSYTGLESARRGVFEMAHGGTLFLDEIGEMPSELQVKLLSVLEDSAVRRLGGEVTHPVDVRVIAATSTEVEGRLGHALRHDLYYRLSVLRIHLPPLRERRGDIPILCEHILADVCGAGVPSIPEDEMKRLMAHDWPGNVRELRNLLERAAIIQKGPCLQPSCIMEVAVGSLSPPPPEEGRTGDAARPVLSLQQVEREHIRHALEACDSNQTRTAEALGIALSTLKRKLKKYGLRRL